MPLFEYKCEKCGHLFEKIEKHSASQTKKCPKCGGKAPRQFAAPAIQFKGSGWYVTDYGGKQSSAAPSGESSGDGAAAKSTEKSGEKSGEKSAESKAPAEKSSSKKEKK
ncbi:MAG: FmdB family zinc ribbon protein [Candidatus Acidiferrales bacterium]